MIGSIQWTVSIGRLDVAITVISLSGYCSIPRVWHMERTKKVIGYLSKIKYAFIRFRIGLPDYSDILRMKYEWAHSVYGNVKEEPPRDAPEALGKHISITHYIDENLYHDVLK